MNCPALSLSTERFWCFTYSICKYFMGTKRQEERMKFNHLLLLSESSSIGPLACAAVLFHWFGGPAQRKPLLSLAIGYWMEISRDPSLHLSRVCGDGAVATLSAGAVGHRLHSPCRGKKPTRVGFFIFSVCKEMLSQGR